MKKETITEEKVINTPAGGVLIGKDKEGQTIIPNDGSLGGFLTGKLHKDGGIKAIVKSTGQPIEMQANEIVITAPAVADTTKRNFQGKMMTNREILSKINSDGGGLAFADGGEMPSSFKPKGKKYTYGGKLMSDSEILKQINDCGCEHDSEGNKKKMKYGGNLSKGMTLGDIANRHNVSLKHINEQLLLGIEKEKEHGGTKAERIAIAKDHLVENPNYYSIVQKIGLEKGGVTLFRKEDLVKDAKNGNSPSRDLNNYNDLIDVQEDGVVGNHVDFPNQADQDLSAAAIAFSDGGDISFLDDLDIVFAEGGETSSDKNKPIVESVTVTRTHPTTTGEDRYKELVGKTFYSFSHLQSQIKTIFNEQDRFIGGFTIQINEVDKAKIFIKFENKKNTVANYNPLTGGYLDFEKQALRNQPRTYNYFNWDDFKNSSDEEPKTKEQSSRDNDTQSSIKPILEYIEIFNYVTFPKLKGVKINSLFELYLALSENVKEGVLNLIQMYFYTTGEPIFVSIFFKTSGEADYNTFVTTGTTFKDFEKFFLSLKLQTNERKTGTVSSDLNTDKFIGEQKDKPANEPSKEPSEGQSKSSEKKLLKYVKLENEKSTVEIYDIIDLYNEVNGRVSKKGDGDKSQIFSFNLNEDSTPELIFFAKKIGYPDDDTFITSGKDRNDFRKFFLNLSLTKGGKLTDKFNVDIFLGNGKVNKLSYAYGEKDGTTQYGFVNNSKEFFEKTKEAWGSGLRSENNDVLFVSIPLVENTIRTGLTTVINLSTTNQEGRIEFNPEKGTLLDLEDLLKNKWFEKKEEKLDWKDFIETKSERESNKKEQPKEESKPQESVDFEIERKYLFARINALSKELEFKRPSLTNEEIGFYSREINKLILRLRKVTESQESLKPISERLKAVYSVKWGDYNKEYPETNLMSINGSKSQLTESEYQSVRNFEFKSFFGDWEKAYLEKNTGSVSQILNKKTMEPLAVYHGTDTLFTDWKTYATNNAHYFSQKRSFAEWFASSWENRSDKAGVDSKILKQLNPNRGKFIYRCFLDIRNPVDFSRFGVEKRPVKEFLMFLKINYGIGDYDFWTSLGSASPVTAETPVFAWQIIRLWQNFTMYIKAYTTYDGYIFYEYNPDTPSGGLDNASLCFCAFESNQVKFTEAYEFNALSNDSRFNFGGEL